MKLSLFAAVVIDVGIVSCHNAHVPRSARSGVTDIYYESHMH